ncbi:zinc-binding alcohol dehydrogenase family protein [Curtobacterium sp. VKM Ac-1376]|uniref:zinc-binding alcohol dehydrogenase family protein n=1 Tax=Curtobacterium sp. VKM Ac-1376 TaxID=123312 RepID=UPI00188CCCDB|nr:zinc-binding alcohol dehydrogenase family protein [Curtobacterium sp. VKM Ac-1376]MBF4613394.1 zinc-binding alcohol dehydrogenase family protein [Curtobacterium sp. VKM Ac-1376]
MSSSGNTALWTTSSGRFTVGPAPVPQPAPGELVVRAEAVAVNPVDAVSGLLRHVVYPKLRYPVVLGSDVAGTVTGVGTGVERFRIGDRVVGYAAGQEQHRNSSAEGAFQHHVLLLERVTTEVPADLSPEQAAVLPLAVSTAAAGLFEPDQLALPLPTADSAERNGVVLVWGASTSVGANAVQLARAAGYAVIGTASPKNHAFVQSLGAEAVFDYRDDAAARRILEELADQELAGTLAFGRGSLTRTLPIVRAATGSGRLASAYPTPATTIRARLAQRHGVHVTAIWGGRPTRSEVGPAIFRDFLPDALRTGRYRATPTASVVGTGLDAIPAALAELRAGVSARKLVVTLP